MTSLKDILYKVTLNAVVGDTAVSINNIHFDSRNISKADAFVAIKGTVSDGHDFIKKAISNKFHKNIDLYNNYVINFTFCFRTFCKLLRLLL